MTKRRFITLSATVFGVLGLTAVLIFAGRQLINEPASYYYVRADGGVETEIAIEALTEPLFVVRVNGKQGFMDLEGNLVIPAIFDHAYPFSGGLAAVCVNGRSGFIDTTGAFVIQPQFAQANFFKEGLSPVRRSFNEPWIYIDRTGKCVIEPRSDTASRFHEGVARVGFETAWSKQRGNFADVGIECRYRYIDQKGRYVRRPDGFRFGVPPSPSGLTPTFERGLWGYVDAAGTWVIPPRFTQAHDFSEGLAAACTGAGCGYIDEQGDFVIEPRFGYAYAFRDGLAEVTVGASGNRVLVGYIDREGNFVWEPSE